MDDKQEFSQSLCKYPANLPEDCRALLAELEDDIIASESKHSPEETSHTSQLNGTTEPKKPLKSIDMGSRNCNFNDYYFQASVSDDRLKDCKTPDTSFHNQHSRLETEDLSLKMIPIRNTTSFNTNLKRKRALTIPNNYSKIAMSKQVKLIMALPVTPETLSDVAEKPLKRNKKSKLAEEAKPISMKKTKKLSADKKLGKESNHKLQVSKSQSKVKENDSNKVVISTCLTFAEFEEKLKADANRRARNEAKRRAHLYKKKLKEGNFPQSGSSVPNMSGNKKNSHSQVPTSFRPCPMSKKKNGILIVEEKPKMKYKGIYSDEDKKRLTQIGRFFIEKDSNSAMKNSSVKKIDEQTLYRLDYNLSLSRKGSIHLQQFSPVTFKQRLFHMAVDLFKFDIKLDTKFWEKYQPVCVKRVGQTRDGKSIMQYFPNEGLIPYLGKLNLTCYLAPTYEVFLQILLYEAMNTNFINENVIGKKEPPKFFEAWMKVDSLIASKIDSIMSFKKTLVMKEIFPQLLDYPIISVKHCYFTGSRDPCLYCLRKKIVGTYKIIFSGDKYNAFTFDSKSKDQKPPPQLDKTRNCCIHCKDDLQILSRLIHHKIFAFVCCREAIKKIAASNPTKTKAIFSPHEVANFFLNEYDWVQNMFHDFQVLLAEADKVLAKLEKDVTLIKIHNAEDEDFAKKSFMVKQEVEETEANDELEGSAMLHLTNGHDEKMEGVE